MSKHIFITVRDNPVCKGNVYWISDSNEGDEPLYRAKLTSGPRGAKLTQVSWAAVPFYLLAPHLYELGARINKAKMRKPLAQGQGVVEEVESFQREHEDIIEPELEKRQRAANPTLTGKTGEDEVEE